MCWLCAYQGEALGKRLNEFIIKHIGVMDLHCISLQVSDYLLLQEPKAVAANKDDVFVHISNHMLHPKVRTAVLLRQLLEFASLLQVNLVVQEGGLCTFDKANAELYLKVINQIMTLYKADTHSMLFSGEDSDEKRKQGGSSSLD
jgi:hypothetical protein